MSEKPWLKWYPADWRADPRLRMCSLAARGLWIELLGYMHESPRYGYLLIGDSAPTIKQIAMLVGEPPKAVERALDELSSAGVFSIDGTIIYSRRMVRDKLKADADRVNGRLGGNPQIALPDKPGVNPPDKAHIPEARDQSSVGSYEPPGVPPPVFDPEKPVYDLGTIVLGKGSGGLVTKLINHHNHDYGKAMEVLDRCRKKSNAKEFLMGHLRGASAARAEDVLDETDRMYRRMGVQ